MNRTSQTAASAAHHLAPSLDFSPTPEESCPDEPPPDDGWIDGLGEIHDEHAVLLGHDIGIMCALIWRGCAEVTELDRAARPEPAAADLVILTDLDDKADVVGAIARARRGLVGCGRIVVRTCAQPTHQLRRAIIRSLQQHGFSVLRVSHQNNRSVLSAESPMFGPLLRA